MINSDSTRRGFLGGALTAAGLGAAAPTSAAPAADDLKLGVASYSLRQFQRGLAIKMMQRLNVPYICIKEFHLPYSSTPEEAARAAKEFARGGLKIVGGGVIYMQRDDDEDVRRYFEYAKSAGMPLIVGAPSQQSLPRVEKFVKQYNIPVAIHNHGPEDKQFPTPESVLKAIQGMDPRVGLCIDAGHTTRTGANLLDSIRAAGSRLLDFHIKDLKDLRDGKSQVPVGDGAMPVVDIFKLLKQMNFQGYVNLEYEIEADDPLLGMAKSFAYMRGVLAGLRGASS
ncbi:MAG: sugar phosphate isomerase/epimerase [Acidobacteria bacterium]|nr:sugar phosphate isomerase/epimerase [Acidobacteriota bacterium]